MKIMTTKWVLLCFLFGLLVSNFAMAVVTSQQAEEIFNLAEQGFPQYFSPALATQISPPEWLYYRGPYNNNIYLGVNANDSVYVVGGTFGNIPVNVGTNQELLTAAFSQSTQEKAEIIFNKLESVYLKYLSPHSNTDYSNGRYYVRFYTSPVEIVAIDSALHEIWYYLNGVWYFFDTLDGANEQLCNGGCYAKRTIVDATSMLQDNVTLDVTEIRIVGSDAEGNVVSSQLVPRQAAANFSVATDLAKVELELITKAGKQVGKIIFEP